MKTRLFLTALMVAWAVNLGLAQAPQGDRAAFARQFEALFLEGNRHYVETANKARLLPVIDSLQALVDQGRETGLLTPSLEDSLLVAVKMDKLNGDYHYLNSDDEKGSFAKAEEHFRSALAFTEDEAHARLRDVFYYQFVMHEELGQLYYKQGRYAEAYQEMKTADDHASFYSPSEDEQLDILSQLAMCEARVAKFDSAKTNIQTVIDNYRDKDTERYGEALRKKAKILMLQQENTGTGMADPTDEALQCYKDYFALKKADALQNLGAMSEADREAYWMRIRPFVVDCYRIESADPAFLYDVTLFSKALLLELNNRDGQQNLGCTWTDIQGRLGSKECAIEFIQYEKQGQQKMAALVMKSQGTPQFVAMPSPDSVMHYKIGRFSIEERLRHISAKGEETKSTTRIYTDSTGFFHCVWPSRLLRCIGDAKDVWFAPVGFQHRIAIEYALPEETAHYQCHRLTSTRMLMKRSTGKAKRSPMGSALFVGGVSYNANGASERMANDSIAYSYVLREGIRFDSLDNSLPEIQTIIGRRRNPRDLVLTGASATESAFRTACTGRSIIHISSHGLFKAAKVPLGTDLKPCLTDNALSESLIALSGINGFLRDPDFRPTATDGLLSAKEIATLDLSQTQLVVLSCCETGLGYITADGVYGIQRGLKNAGAQAIVITLWDINDEATNHFMVYFHQQLQKGRSPYDAFQATRRSMAELDPVLRDPFILIDAI